MTNKLKNRLADVFWEFVINLIDTFWEIKDRVVGQKQSGSIRKIMEEINSNIRGPFFRVTLRKDEGLLDFSQNQFEKGRMGVPMQVPVLRGQYRLERKMVEWGSDNPEMPWLVLENTTIGAREAWWQSRAALNEISLKLDADI